MLILLPPSEGKTAPRRGRPLDLGTLGSAALTEPRRQLLETLTGLCATSPEAAATVLGLGPTQRDEVRRNAGLLRAPTARADRVYSGVLYDALALDSLDAAARRRANRWLVTVSALFGLVRPADRIPAYRLPGGVSLPGVGPLPSFWSRRLDPAVRESAGRRLVVDVRSGTYAPYWRPSPDQAGRVAVVRVLHEVDGARTVVSHFNKATKGRLVRALLEDGSAPASPARFADHLRALGWKVEDGGPGRHGTRLDVVVEELLRPASAQAPATGR